MAKLIKTIKKGSNNYKKEIGVGDNEIVKSLLFFN